MTDDLCPLLDDYLLGELPNEARTRFDAHLAECETCRSMAEQQTVIDEALKAAADSITFSSELTVRVGERVARVQRRRRMAITMCCAAGVAAIAFSIWSIVRTEDHSPSPLVRGAIAEDDRSPQNAIEPLPGPEPETPVPPATQELVQIDFPKDVLALRVESGDPDVTLYQVFPTVGVQAATP